MKRSHIFPILSLETKNQHIEEVAREIEKRWEEIKLKKTHFSLYKKKSDREILLEFQSLHSFRLKLWYRNPEDSPHVCHKDYEVAQDLLEKGYYRTVNNVAFAYNRTDSSYNASTILIEDLHFIALQEPHAEILPLFFKFLINHHVSLLIRLNPEKEYSEGSSIKYWEDRIEGDPALLKIDILHLGKNFDPVYIPYFSIETWMDDQADEVERIYHFVKRVRSAYKEVSHKGSVACHCASGVGRTGTFIAAMALADRIEKSNTKEISIEEIVLKLSIQRPNLVGTPEQYLMLYRFVDYCLKTRNS